MEEVYEQHSRMIPGATWSPGNDDKNPFSWTENVSLFKSLIDMYVKFFYSFLSRLVKSQKIRISLSYDQIGSGVMIGW
jgi:hypothetical protein